MCAAHAKKRKKWKGKAKQSSLGKQTDRDVSCINI